MHVLGVQLDITWEDAQANRTKVEQMIGAGVGADTLIVLPEMFATGFTMNVAAAVRDHEKNLSFVQELSRRFKSTCVAGVATPGERGLGLNQSVVAGPSGELIATYTKLHPFTPGGEKDHYQAGSRIVTFKWHDFTVAPLVCYDLRFPEVFRKAIGLGVDFFVVVANWPMARVDHWITLLRARAIENQAYVLGVNRCGADPNVRYPGRSMLVDPAGIVRADAGDRESLLAVEVSIELVKKIRHELPFLRDMRNDASSW